jgi:1-acyl-sn-glycerol-3-phosphate acyltransferase
MPAGTEAANRTVPIPADRDVSFRAVTLGAAAGAIICATAVLLLPLGAVTLFRARRLYARCACLASRAVLALYGVRIALHQAAPFPRTQTVYISNHVCTLDLFVLVALGLPNCRFFLSGFLRKILPLGIIATMMGTFFTVPQDQPVERRRIFKRAAATLRATRESVYLSPEGGRITTGRIGHFNKGSFHLATVLGAPIVPMYFLVPPEVDPGLGYNARPGTVHVHVLRPIDTSGWTEADVPANTEMVRALFARLNEEMRCG